MKLQLIILLWVVILSIYDGFYVQGAPLNSEKDKDEFVFLLPDAERSNLYANVKRAAFPADSYPANGLVEVKDSYGNLLANGKKIVDADGVQFEIPSYASGITEIRKPLDELLPPLASGEIREDAGGIPEVSEPPIELLPPLFDDSDKFSNTQKDNSLSDIANRINLDPNSEISVEDTKNTEENKSKTEEITTIKYDGEKYTGGFGGAPGILGEQKEVGYAIKAKEVSSAEQSTEPISTTTSHSSEIEGEITVPSTVAPSTTSQDIQYSSSLHTTEIGLSSSTETQPETTTLNTENLTTFELPKRETDNPFPTPIPTTSEPPKKETENSFPRPIPTTSEPPKKETENPFPTPIPTTSEPPAKETENPFPTQIPSFFSISTNVLSPTPRIIETVVTSQNIPVPPSILLLPPEYSFPSVSTSTIIQQQFPTTTPREFPIRFGFVQTPFTVKPTDPQNQDSLPLSVPETKNHFVFNSNIPRIPQTNSGVNFSLSPTSPFFTQPINTNKESKYTGGFGGAPGVLGNQNKPGFAIQPDGSIKDPDHTYRPPVTAATSTPAPFVQNVVHQQAVTPVKYEKYTGGFGGPPGILIPHDNKNAG